MPIPTPGICLKTTIANGGTRSAVVDLGGGKVTAIGFPAAMTGTTMTFEIGSDPQDLTTFKQVVTEIAGVFSITVTADKVVALDDSAMAVAASRFIRLVSGSAEAAERALQVFVK